METAQKCREARAGGTARDRKERLVANAKCEVDAFVSMSALKVKRTERQEIYAFFK